MTFRCPMLNVSWVATEPKPQERYENPILRIRLIFGSVKIQPVEHQLTRSSCALAKQSLIVVKTVKKRT